MSYRAQDGAQGEIHGAECVTVAGRVTRLRVSYRVLQREERTGCHRIKGELHVSYRSLTGFKTKLRA